MRIVDRKTFLAMPAGTIFSKTWKNGPVSGFQIKGDTWTNDFLCLDMVGCIDCDDYYPGSNVIDTHDKLVEQGISVPFDDEAYGRDGCFDDEDLFMIYEADDLRKIAAIIQRGIEVAQRKEG